MASAKTKQRVRAKKSKATRKIAGAESADARKKAVEPSGTTELVVALNRRSGGDRRKTPDRRKQDIPVPVERRKLQRRAKVNRRRQIDPTTCERDYTNDEIEFMNALDEYKRTSGRMFPTCSEILEVLRNLGYAKIAAQPASPPESATVPGQELPLAEASLGQ